MCSVPRVLGLRPAIPVHWLAWFSNGRLPLSATIPSHSDSGGVGGWVPTRFRAAGMNAFPASCWFLGFYVPSRSNSGGWVPTRFRAAGMNAFPAPCWLLGFLIVLPFGDCGRALMYKNRIVHSSHRVNHTRLILHPRISSTPRG